MATKKKKDRDYHELKLSEQHAWYLGTESCGCSVRMSVSEWLQHWRDVLKAAGLAP